MAERDQEGREEITNEIDLNAETGKNHPPSSRNRLRWWIPVGFAALVAVSGIQYYKDHYTNSEHPARDVTSAQFPAKGMEIRVSEVGGKKVAKVKILTREISSTMSDLKFAFYNIGIKLRLIPANYNTGGDIEIMTGDNRLLP